MIVCECMGIGNTLQSDGTLMKWRHSAGKTEDNVNMQAMANYM